MQQFNDLAARVAREAKERGGERRPAAEASGRAERC